MFRYTNNRLLIIPFIIYILWVLETFLLEGSLGVFTRYQPLPLLLYTIFANIIMGIAVPIVCLRSAFISGAINMFQIGFRSLRRTVLAAIVTGLIGYELLVNFSAFAFNRLALLNAIVLLIPVAIASVMVCFTLLGTHLQAFVRKRGVSVSIVTSVIITGVLFGLTGIAHSPPINQTNIILLLILTGIASAVFFFSVRDVYASTLFVTFGMALVLFKQTDSFYSNQIEPLIYGISLLSIVCLIFCHWYLSKNFKTIKIPIKAK
ncbi:MAG: hypothetical protein ABR887_03605 [Methanoregulaceae archaeon]